jgi:hypothetical protein
MRNESYEKHKIVKEMAHQFTEFMKIHKFQRLPVFKISSITYHKMLSVPEILENTFIDSTVTDSIRGKTYGVDFYISSGYFGPIMAE